MEIDCLIIEIDRVMSFPAGNSFITIFKRRDSIYVSLVLTEGVLGNIVEEFKAYK